MQFEDLPGLALEAAQDVLVAVEEGLCPLVAAGQGRVEGQVGQQIVGIGVGGLQQAGPGYATASSGRGGTCGATASPTDRKSLTGGLVRTDITACHSSSGKLRSASREMVSGLSR